MRPLSRVLVALAMTALLVDAPPSLAEHLPDHSKPPNAAAKQFAADFTPPNDSEWGWPIGGFGGAARGQAIAFNPVILIHGNTEDHTFWDVASETPPLVVNVRNKFKASGYSDQEVWALSLNGAKGTSTANDVNVPDVFSFIQAVREYTGAKKVDLISHSVGVTVARKSLKEHPELLDQVEDFVAIAGANHGTSACRGTETAFSCTEIYPGSPWLEDLNSWNPKGEGDETPGPTRYMTIFDGSGAGDHFYVMAGAFDDTKSPRLSGAENRELPNNAHYTLARGQQPFDIFLAFVKGRNDVVRTDSGLVISPEERAASRGRSLAATGSPQFIRTFGTILLLLSLLVAAVAIYPLR